NGWIGGGDRVLAPLQPRTWVEPELVRKGLAGIAVDLERLCLPPASVEGEHQLPTQPLPQRMLVNDSFELLHDCVVPAEREISLDPLLECSEAQLLEAGDLVLCEGLVRGIGEWWA